MKPEIIINDMKGWTPFPGEDTEYGEVEGPVSEDEYSFYFEILNMTEYQENQNANGMRSTRKRGKLAALSMKDKGKSRRKAALLIG